MQGLDYTTEYIDSNNKPAWMKEVSEAGTVPMMKAGDQWITDSGDICSHLERAFPDTPMGPLAVEGVAEKLFPTFVQFLKATDDNVAEKRAAFLEQLDQLEAHLAANGPFMTGETMGAADASMVRSFTGAWEG